MCNSMQRNSILETASLLLTRNIGWLLLLWSKLRGYCISYRLVCNAADFCHSEYCFSHRLLKSEPLSLIKSFSSELISQQVTDWSEKYTSDGLSSSSSRLLGITKSSLPHVQLKNGTAVARNESQWWEIHSKDLNLLYTSEQETTKSFYWFQEKLRHLILCKLKFILNQCSLNWNSSISDRLHTQNQSR